MKTKTTYTAIAGQEGEGNYWNCGHKHRTVEAAAKCLSEMGDAACCYHAMIYGSDDTMFDRNEFEIFND